MSPIALWCRPCSPTGRRVAAERVRFTLRTVLAATSGSCRDSLTHFIILVLSSVCCAAVYPTISLRCRSKSRAFCSWARGGNDRSFSCLSCANLQLFLVVYPSMIHQLCSSGKSSILKVVFQKLSPHDLMFQEETLAVDVKLVANNDFVQFQTWDFPGDYDLSCA